MKRRIILIHGYGATPQLYWFPWLAEELARRGHQVITPTMPQPFRPELHEWLATLHEAIGEIDENTIIVAHSLGNAATVQYLQSATEGTACRAYIAVAPLLLKRYGRLFPSFFEKPIDGTVLNAHTDSITVLHDRADPWAPFSSARFLEHTCGAKLIVCPGRRHFNNLNRKTPVPEILTAVLSVV